VVSQPVLDLRPENPLGNLRKMSIQEVTEPSEILVCFTRGGTAAHALHHDCKTVLGPWDQVHFSGDAGSGTRLPRGDGRADEGAPGSDEAMWPGQQQHPAAAGSEEPASDRLQQALKVESGALPTYAGPHFESPVRF
jgi:hypothetical protein